LPCTVAGAAEALGFFAGALATDFLCAFFVGFFVTELLFACFFATALGAGELAGVVLTTAEF
jgi:hypothetical protein